ncbi:MAG: hypothetical protein SPL13_00505 [Clostridia bacterium]|nr:hypothetical protein [Clostridia bacterium]
MSLITVSERDYNESNLYYVKDALNDVLIGTGSICEIKRAGGRSVFTLNCPNEYYETVRAEVADKLAEVVAINYKNEYFKGKIATTGLTEEERQILLAGIIAADLDDDKKYAFDKIKNHDEVALDGVYNFRMQPLKKKWAEIIGYIPSGFPNEGLKDFITFLLENRKKRVYVDCGKVYDSHFRRLKKSTLLGGELSVLKEVLLSGCGEIELYGKLPETDEKYIKSFYADRIFFSPGYFC